MRLASSVARHASIGMSTTISSAPATPALLIRESTCPNAPSGSATPRPERLVDRLPERRLVRDVDAGHVAHAIARGIVPDLDQLIDDARPHLGQLRLATRDQHDARAGHGQEARDLPA